METKTSLIRANRTVKLYTVAFIYLNLSLVIYPRYTEFELSVRLCQPFQ